MAYAALFPLTFVYFFARAEIDSAPRACQLGFDIELALFSLTNFAHVGLFAAFQVISSTVFLGTRFTPRQRFFLAAAATLAFGVIVELGEALSGTGNCRARDLIPDAWGVLIGAVVFDIARRVQQPRAIS